MKLARLLVAAAVALIPALAQHEAAAPPQHGDTQQAGQSHADSGEHAKSEGHAGSHSGLEGWKWANFLLLAGGLGYLIGKNAGPFFASRSRQIRKDMAEAEQMRREAEARAAEVDRRLARLQAEIDALRLEAREQQAAETDRVRRQTADDIAKIQQHSEQEIASAAKAARTELKRYSAELALELAEQRLRDSITSDAQDALVKDFVQDLGRTS